MRGARASGIRRSSRLLRLPGFIGRTLDRGDDLVVGAAAADIALHVLDDLRARGFLVLRQERGRGHDLARLAVAALRRLLGNPRFLQRMVGRGRQSFDGRDLLPGDRRDRRDARARRLAVDVHGAGAALGDAAPELGAGEPELVAHHPQQRRVGRLLGIGFPAVDDKLDHGFSPPAGTVIVVPNIRRINGTDSTAIVTTPSPPAIGRSKKAMKLPSALIIELLKFSSSIAPSTMPRIAGATGKPFSSISYPTTPKTSISTTPNAELLIANEP